LTNNELLRLLNYIIERLWQMKHDGNESNEDLIKDLKANGFNMPDIDQAMHIVKKLIHHTKEDEYSYVVTDFGYNGVRCYSADERQLYSKGLLKRLLFLREIFIMNSDLVEEVVDILVNLPVEEDFSEDFVDSLVTNLLWEYEMYDKPLGISLVHHKYHVEH